jgi:DNA repair protein RecN (Recombination protein N)
LTEAKLKTGEEELEREYEQLNNVEIIKEAIDKSLAITTDEQVGVIQNLKRLNCYSKIASFSTDYHNLLERLVSLTIEWTISRRNLAVHLRRLMTLSD